MNTNETNKYFLPAAVIIAGLFIAGAVMWNGSRPAVAPSGAAPSGGIAVDIKNVDTNRRPYIGQENASITIAFWSDFQCPFCRAAEVGGIPQIPTPAALPDIIKNYVDTGKVKVVFMEFPFLGNDSMTAAIYSQAVWKLYPEKYFEWRTKAFEAQDEEGDKGFGNAASIDTLNATISGIDATKIAADVKANTATYQAQVAADKAEAAKVGINSTPSFVIGKEVVAGAYPFAKFQSVIDALLK